MLIIAEYINQMTSIPNLSQTEANKFVQDTVALSGVVRDNGGTIDDYEKKMKEM